MSEDRVDEEVGVPMQGTRAFQISELRDLIEIGSRAEKRMRRVEAPLGMLLAWFFLSVALKYDGLPIVVLTIIFSVLVLRRIYQHRRSADHLSDLEEKLSKLLEDGAELGRSQEAPH